MEWLRDIRLHYLTRMKIVLENTLSFLSVDLFGGAFTNFHLKDADNINPLSFAFTKEQMPENNKSGAPYQGHFLCLGRWGLPSEGEIKAGVPNHGEFANILWTKKENSDDKLFMEATANKEGLHVERKIQLDKNHPVFAVKESVTNLQPLGRLYNMVQHPTLAAPFLDESTIIDCNATIGFDETFYKEATQKNFQWSKVENDEGKKLDLRNPQLNYNSVFSFIVNKESEHGWITAYSPKYYLLFGYVWRRDDYPWIHLWQHWEGDRIKYRGIEFGTAGIHQPFKEIIETAPILFGEKTFAYIDAREAISKNYFSFIYKLNDEFFGVDDVAILNDAIQTTLKENQTVNINVSPELIHEFCK
jgi:hypothetical protein